MSTRFEDYHKARKFAGERAKRFGMDVAIRKVKEFGRNGFNVSFAARMDSDYARAEIVRPNDPFSA